MRLRKQNLAVLFVLIVAALLAIPAVSSLRLNTVSAGVQDTSRSDVAPKEKKAGPQAPGGALAPTNDSCANAVAVTSCPFTDTKSTVGATTEAGEPAPCGAIAATIWYTYTNNTTHTVTVSVNTCNSSPLDTVLAAYKVTGAACDFAGFVNQACNDDFCGDGFQSTIEFNADPGATYKIQAGGFAGSTGTLTINFSCVEQLCDPIVIHGTLGSGDPNFTGPHASGNVVGRLNRNGIASSCAAPKTCLIFDPANNRAYDSYSIPNQSGSDACVSVNLTETAGQTCNLQSNAYLGTFVPSSICTNYQADPGLSTGVPPTPTNFSTIVPAGQTLVVVVMTTNPGETGCTYTVTVQGNLCQQFDFCVQDDAIPSRFILINSTTGGYEFHDCSKNLALAGTGTAGIFFCKVTLSDGGGPVPNRSVSVALNPCTGFGNAQVRLPGSKITININDSDIFNNICACPPPPPPPPPR